MTEWKIVKEVEKEISNIVDSDDSFEIKKTQLDWLRGFVNYSKSFGLISRDKAEKLKELIVSCVRALITIEYMADIPS